MPSSSALTSAHQQYWWRVVAMTTRHIGDPAMAEEATAAAFEQAAKTWPRDGIPESVFAWLITAARNKAIDDLRRRATARDKAALIAAAQESASADGMSVDDEVHMMALCAHPSLSESSAIAAMLRFVCGVSTDSLAGAFLVQRSAMAARLTRARKTLRDNAHELVGEHVDVVQSRLPDVRRAIMLSWTMGHTATHGEAFRDADLAHAALRLARTLATWDDSDESSSLAATLELSAARWDARVLDGVQVTLEDADRRRWNWPLIDRACARLRPLTGEDSVYRLSAEVERLLTCKTWEATDWPTLVDVYAALLQQQPDPVTALARSVAMGYAHSPETALADIAGLMNEPAATSLVSYPYTYAAMATFLEKLGRQNSAAEAFEAAADTARNDAERAFFLGKAESVRAGAG